MPHAHNAPRLKLSLRRPLLLAAVTLLAAVLVAACSDPTAPTCPPVGGGSDVQQQIYVGNVYPTGLVPHEIWPSQPMATGQTALGTCATFVCAESEQEARNDFAAAGVSGPLLLIGGGYWNWITAYGPNAVAFNTRWKAAGSPCTEITRAAPDAGPSTGKCAVVGEACQGGLGAPNHLTCCPTKWVSGQQSAAFCDTFEGQPTPGLYGTCRLQFGQLCAVDQDCAVGQHCEGAFQQSICCVLGDDPCLPGGAGCCPGYECAPDPIVGGDCPGPACVYTCQ